MALRKVIPKELVIPQEIEVWERYDCGMAYLSFSDGDSYEGFLLYGDPKQIHQKLLEMQRKAFLYDRIQELKQNGV